MNAAELHALVIGPYQMPDGSTRRALWEREPATRPADFNYDPSATHRVTGGPGECAIPVPGFRHDGCAGDQYDDCSCSAVADVVAAAHAVLDAKGVAH